MKKKDFKISIFIYSFIPLLVIFSEKVTLQVMLITKILPEILFMLEKLGNNVLVQQKRWLNKVQCIHIPEYL